MILKQILYITISTILGYVSIRYVLPYFIHRNDIIEISNSGLPELIAIVVWVMQFYIVGMQNKKPYINR